VLLKDVHPGSETSTPRKLTVLDDALIFFADDGIHGHELWRTDGTAEGTALLIDLNPGAASGPVELWQSDFVFDGFYYFEGNDGVRGPALWRTDGTAEGTTFVVDTRPEPTSSGLHHYFPMEDIAFLNGEIYFSGGGEQQSNPQLWKTDGTPEGSQRLTNFFSYNSSLSPRYLIRTRDRITLIGILVETISPVTTYGYGIYAFDPELSPPPPPDPRPGRLVNISTRGRIDVGDDVMIGGFIIEGGPVRAMIRGRGPSLAEQGVPKPLVDPQLSIYADGVEIAYNDDWADTQEEAIAACGLAPTYPTESATLIDLEPGVYTAITSGVGGTTGIGIAEGFGLYDLTPSEPGRLINISTRARVGAGDEVMIGGFVIEGPQAATVLLRARGPSLTASGLPHLLANPYLRLYSGATQIDFNDDWQEGSRVAEIEASGLAPTDARESALYRTLSPGAYTLMVEGVGGTIGTGIVEVFDVTEE
jgi:ELWxxDGT repeat protein